uniref:Mitotic spindle assembly checkpoint protein MAD1 n=1 Tax=Astyanax mexicanus TaxID=7994 RepID=A0A8B9HCU1_ASTMX
TELSPLRVTLLTKCKTVLIRITCSEMRLHHNSHFNSTLLNMEEAAERIRSHTSLLQLTQEKQQMELSHKRARIELEKEAHSSSRDLQRQMDLNQDLLTKLRRLEEKEGKANQALNDEMENKKALKRSLEEFHKQANDKDNRHAEANQCPFKVLFFFTVFLADLRKQMESAELKNQRLKEVFQKKIQEFRTVCYVLTGYQIDITVENQYRLTSVYAERMEDSLLFKASGAVGSGSMQLLETDFSRTLSELVDLHLFHQKSIPVFLSAVTLDLFSRQTVV